ncbi:MAG TPA: Uma2 family endonuclease [Gemmataceae bacterium]|nr:Uma2 family endonuclease [Gemmataceae bacterium]
MSTITRPPEEGRTRAVPFLVNGQLMKQPEFHRRYEACPPDERWELIGGIVYMASPLRYPHGNYDFSFGTALGLYAVATPGVEGAHNVTSILGEESEPQPDLALRIAAEHGGRSRINEAEYLEGPPEFIAEIAYSSLDIDMHRKREDYQEAGVAEYLVVCIEEQELHWFDFRTGHPLRPTRQGVYRSRVFPGLWIDGAALLARDSKRLMEVVQQGLASPEHARFVKRLQAEWRKRSPK